MKRTALLVFLTLTLPLAGAAIASSDLATRLLSQKAKTEETKAAFLELSKLDPKAKKDLSVELSDSVTNKEDVIARSACYALIGLGDDGTHILLKHLKTGSRDVRALIVVVIGRPFPWLPVQPSQKFRPALVHALKDPDANIRMNAVFALGKMGGSAVPISKALTDEDNYVRRRAAESLRDMGKDAGPASSVLKKALKDPDDGVRDAAREALNNINEN